MNSETKALEPILLDGLFQVKGVLKCLLHSILFNRSLGNVRPKDCECDLFNVSYVKVDHENIEKAVEIETEKFYQNVKANGKGKMCVSFYTSHSVQSFFGIISTEEKRVFERWFIPISVVPDSVAPRPSPFNGAMLRDRIVSIVSFVNEKKDHIPPIGDLLCYNFEITIPSSAGDTWGFTNFVEILKTGPPTLIR